MTSPRFTLLSALLLAVAGCSSRQQAEPEPPFAEIPRIQVHVENNSAQSLRIFVLIGADETPIGRVGALSQMTTTLERVRQGAAMHLVARPSVDMRDNRAHQSEAFSALPDQRVTWILRASPGVSDVPQFSSLQIRPCTPEDDC